jgi:hypothetical protein
MSIPYGMYEKRVEGTGREDTTKKREGREGKGTRQPSKTYLIDSIEILAKIAQVDVGLDNILQSHISPLENSFQVLDDLSSPILNLFISQNHKMVVMGLTVPSTICPSLVIPTDPEV